MEVSKSDNFLEQVDKRVTLMAALSSKILQDTKSLIRHSYRETLNHANNEECKLFLKYLGDHKVLDTLKTNWLPDVIT
ncbi:unnamed protein product [Pocillopora meandrina]|uniref:Uncharacterized protein n=1 Tax=Pocillopora meandrina TaxID=46732 RepID=A0AAU9WUI6_9CNID|nr:unnamed protein product [Pocillopora meandrina]